MKAPLQLSEFGELLKNIEGMAEQGRQSVNNVTEALRQIDVDAAAAITRGYFLMISQYCEAQRQRIAKATNDKPINQAMDMHGHPAAGWSNE